MADAKTTVEVAADASGFVQTMKHAEDALDGFLSGLAKGNFAGLSEAFGSLGAAAGPLLGIAAAGLAIHEAFSFAKESVDETVKWNLEAGKLSRQLGITTQEASVLANSLEDHGVAVESYTGAANFLTRALQNNSLGFKNLGIETKLADGSFRNTNDLMSEVIDKLNAMPDSTEKNIIGQQLFGKGWQTNRDILLVGKKALEETAAQMEALGTKVTPEAEAASRRYSLAVADVHDVLSAFGINLGNKIIPVLTDFLHWLADIGTVAVQGFRVGLDFLGDVFSKLYQVIAPVVGALVSGLGAALSAVATIIETVWGFINGLINAIVDAVPGLRTLSDWLGLSGGGLAGAGKAAMIALEVVSTALTGVAGVVEFLIRLFDMFVTLVTGTLGSIGKAFVALGKDGFLAAREVMNQEMDKTLADTEAKGRELAAGVGRTKERILNIWKKKEAEPFVVPNFSIDTGQNSGINIETKDNTGELVKKWKEQLNELKAARENWFTWDNKRELEFWEEKLKHTRKGTDAYRAVIAEIAKFGKDIAKDQADLERDRIKKDSDAQAANADAEIEQFKRTQKRKIEALAAAEAESKEAIKGKADIAKTGATEDVQSQIAMKSVVDQASAEERFAQEKARLREEELRGVIELEQKKLEVRLIALDKLRALAQDDKAQEKIGADEIKLIQEFNKKKEVLLAAAEDGRTKDAQEASKRRLAIELAAGKKEADDRARLAKEAEGYLQPFVDGFSSGIKKIIDGSLSLGDAIKGIGKMLVGAFSDMIGQMVTNWIKGLAQMLAQWIATKVQELFFHETTEDAKAAATVKSATIGGTAAAVEGGVKAGSSAASVPGIGWMIAIPVAIAVVGGLLALMGSMKSAAGGFDIPSGMNPVTQLHSEEMVLPAPLANAVRDMAGGGDVSGQGGGAASANHTTVHVHVSAMDGADVMRTLHKNRDALVAVLGRAKRDGKL